MEDHVVGTGIFNEHTGQRGRPAEFFRRKRDGE
jgi:hypothetical protein